MPDLGIKSRVLQIIAGIPTGKVMYYGQVAALIGSNPRTVGWILSGLSEAECEQFPWQRVVAKNGHISTLKLGLKGLAQIQLLTQEGVEVVGERVDMSKCLFEYLN